MLISFDNMQETMKPNFKGGEKEAAMKIVRYEDDRIMMGRLEPGASIGLHTHEESCEVYYFLSGTGKSLYDGAWEPVRPGVAHYCPKGHSHSLVNTGEEDLVFFAAVCHQ